MFLAGLDEGQTVFFEYYISRLKSEEEKTQFRTFAKIFTAENYAVSDLRKEIDLFYEDSANIKVPVGDAEVYANYKINGASSKELDNVIAKMRSMYNKE